MARRPMLVPFSLRVESLAAMLNFELADDPHYDGLEIQAFDDPTHGRGLLVFVGRRDDGRTDVYVQPGLRVEPEGYGLGKGLGRWVETEIEGYLRISAAGVDADVRLRDSEGRAVEVRAEDRGGRRSPVPFLAPFGAGIDRPAGLLLVWMRRFDLLRTTATVRIAIDGRPARTGRLPGALLHRRRLVKAAADLAAVTVNPSHDGSVPIVEEGPGTLRLDPAGGVTELSSRTGQHQARLVFTPAIPRLAELEESASAQGDWRLGIDEEPDLIRGMWAATRRDDRVDLSMEITRGWRPRGLPPLMRFVTRAAPVFRRWPTTYLWRGTVILGDPPHLTGGWERTDGGRGESYRRLTGSS